MQSKDIKNRLKHCDFCFVATYFSAFETNFIVQNSPKQTAGFNLHFTKGGVTGYKKNPESKNQGIDGAAKATKFLNSFIRDLKECQKAQRTRGFRANGRGREGCPTLLVVLIVLMMTNKVGGGHTVVFLETLGEVAGRSESAHIGDFGYVLTCRRE